MKQFLINKIIGFRRKDDGNVSVEFVIYMPVLIFIFMFIYSFFDIYRQESIGVKAAYTVSDVISRETQELNEDYIDSMYNVAKLMVRSGSNLSMRITIVRWDAATDRYYIDWSRERGDAFDQRVDDDVTNANHVSNIRNNLPTMPDQERVILVETIADTVPPFNVGLSDYNIVNFVFTRPRFAPLVRFDGVIIPGDTHDDGTVLAPDLPTL